MDLQLTHELLHILDRHGRSNARGHAQPRFRLPAKPRDLRGCLRFLSHHITTLINGTRFTVLINLYLYLRLTLPYFFSPFHLFHG